jgi:hypothetical protein
MANTDEWVTIAEAARQLGITERGVRLRAQNGKIARRRCGGRVQFRVEAQAEEAEVRLEVSEVDSALPEAKPEVSEVQPEVGAEETEASAPSWSAEAEVLAEDQQSKAEVPEVTESALVAQLRSENAFLRARIEEFERAAEQQRQTVLYAQQLALEAERKLAIAPAPQETVDAGTGARDGQNARKAPWWKFWRKQTG